MVPRVARGTLLFFVLAAASVGAHGRAIAEQSTQGWIAAPSIALAKNRLYFSAYVFDANNNDAVHIRLHGEGAPDETISGRVKRTSYRCEGWNVSTRSGSSGEVRRACSLDATKLEEGAYRLALTVAGRTVHEQPFDIVSLPAGNKKKVLAVDPVMRANKGYFVSNKFILWVPVDARRRGRLVTIQFFRNGEPLPVSKHDVRKLRPGSATIIAKGPSLLGGDALLRIVPVAISKAHAKVWGGKYMEKDPTGTWTIIAMLDDKVQVGAWEYEQKAASTSNNKARRPRKFEVRGVPYWTDYGLLSGPPTKKTGVPASLWEQTKQLARDRLKEIASMSFKGGLGDVFKGYPAQVVCAAAKDKKVFNLLSSKAQVAREMGRAAWSYGNATQVLANRFSTKSEKKNARRTRRATIRGAAGAQRVARKLRRRLKRLTRRYKPECLKKMLGEIGRIL
jgi:hypothetical protein